MNVLRTRQYFVGEMDGKKSQKNALICFCCITYENDATCTFHIKMQIKSLQIWNKGKYVIGISTQITKKK